MRHLLMESRRSSVAECDEEDDANHCQNDDKQEIM